VRASEDLVLIRGNLAQQHLQTKRHYCPGLAKITRDYPRSTPLAGPLVNPLAKPLVGPLVGPLMGGRETREPATRRGAWVVHRIYRGDFRDLGARNFSGLGVSRI